MTRTSRSLRISSPKMPGSPALENREAFDGPAVEIGEDIDVRECAMFMILVARALERIADNALAIAEQTVFLS